MILLDIVGDEVAHVHHTLVYTPPLPPWPESLKIAMAQRGVSQKAMAIDMGCHISAVSHWVHGKTPTVRDLLRLCRILKTNPSVLLGYNEEAPNGM